jgi:hypothetical protein
VSFLAVLRLPCRSVVCQPSPCNFYFLFVVDHLWVCLFVCFCDFLDAVAVSVLVLSAIYFLFLFVVMFL